MNLKMPDSLSQVNTVIRPIHVISPEAHTWGKVLHPPKTAARLPGAAPRPLAVVRLLVMVHLKRLTTSPCHVGSSAFVLALFFLLASFGDTQEMLFASYHICT